MTHIQLDSAYSHTRQGLTFHKTCDAFPEQYEVFRGSRQVGYVRLRWGHFRVDVPACGHREVFHHIFPEDASKGCFDDDAERDRWLDQAAHAILRNKRRWPTQAAKGTRYTPGR